VIQRFLPEVKAGDKRIILVDGEFAGAVNRVPAAGRSALQHGARGAAQATELSPRERRNLRGIGVLACASADCCSSASTSSTATSPRST